MVAEPRGKRMSPSEHLVENLDQTPSFETVLTLPVGTKGTIQSGTQVSTSSENPSLAKEQTHLERGVHSSGAHNHLCLFMTSRKGHSLIFKPL